MYIYNCWPFEVTSNQIVYQSTDFRKLKNDRNSASFTDYELKCVMFVAETDPTYNLLLAGHIWSALKTLQLTIGANSTCQQNMKPINFNKAHKK